MDADAPEKPGDGTTTRFAALAFPAYRLLFFSGLFVFLAVQAQVIARGWLAKELTGTNAGVGGVYLGFGIPMMILTPLGGVAADRLPKRFVIVAAQAVLVFSAFFIGFAEAFDALEYWMLIVASAMQAAGFALYGPARIAFTGELVGRETVANAVVLAQMSLNSTRVFGPAVAGALIGVETVGAEGVYFITGVLTLVALVFSIRLPAGAPHADRVKRSVAGELLDGVRYVRDRPPVLALIVVSYVVVMIGFPYLALLPNIADNVFDVGSEGYGLFSAASAVGAVVVSLAIARIAGGSKGWRVQVGSGIAFGVGLILLAASPTFFFGLLAIVVLGGAASGFQSMNNSLALTATDMEYHGRVQSLMMLSFSGFGIAALPIGRLADALGIRETMVGMGLVVIAAMGVYVLSWQRIQRRTEQPVLG